MKRFKVIICWWMLFVFSGLSSALAQQVATVEHFGTLERVYRIDNVYVAGQPDLTTFQYFRNRGGVTVINLRDPSELKFDEEALVRQLGLRYFNFPVTKGKPLNASTLLTVSWAIEKQGAVPILLHCSSGNRAASALAVHLLRSRNLSNEKVLTIAEEAGLNKPKAREKLEAVLEKGIHP